MIVLFLYMLFNPIFCEVINFTHYENYLNQIDSFSATFLQNSEGKLQKGKIYFQKPDKFRADYYGEKPYFFLLQSPWLLIHEKKENRSRWLPTRNLPFFMFLTKIFLKGKVNFKKQFHVISSKEYNNMIAIKLTLPSKRISYTITLFFEKEPIKLKGWIIKQPGKTIEANLKDIKINSPIDPNIFIFKRKKLL